MPLKNWCSIHARWSKSSLKHFIRFCGIFPSLQNNFIAYDSSKVSSRADCIFETHQLWQSGFSRVYSNCCCCCLFEPEIIKIGQSSHKMYSNNILNFQESTTILKAWTKKKLETYWRHHVYFLSKGLIDLWSLGPRITSYFNYSKSSFGEDNWETLIRNLLSFQSKIISTVVKVGS